MSALWFLLSVAVLSLSLALAPARDRDAPDWSRVCEWLLALLAAMLR